jgi:amino acid adenylation domain-containing protein
MLDQTVKRYSPIGELDPGVTVVQLFEDQVRKSPAAVAVECGDDQLTYLDLNRRANNVARRLRAKKSGPERRVAVCLERGLPMVIALFGILKSGAAYIPLDPGYPPERLRYMLGDAAADILVTQQKLLGHFGDFAGDMVCLDPDWPTVEGNCEENIGAVAGPDNLAYVIYTSGTSGRPKGVMIQHGNLVNMLRSFAEILQLGKDDRQLGVATFSFDMSVADFFPPLIVGGRLVLFPASAREIHQLAELLERGEITVMQATPTLWRSLVVLENVALPQGFKAVCGGEAMDEFLAQRLKAASGELWNFYGPTETTVWSTAGRIEGRTAATLSVGQPLANTRVYVLTSELERAPAGARAEIYIAGQGVARGYLNDPALTAERFLPDPFAGEGERMYRTGDLGQCTDGVIECSGRADTQVKLRGHRIELGEIECLLSRHEIVRHAAVVLRENDTGGKKIVAYVATQRARVDVPLKSRVQLLAEAPSILRKYLEEMLPGHMVPSTIVLLEDLPLTASGKLDRNALPAPQVLSNNEYVAPSTETEISLAQIWATVLQLRCVGLHDNFLELGGHSLLATQMVSRIRSTLNVDVPLDALFESGLTLQRVALLVDELKLKQAGKPIGRTIRATLRRPASAPSLVARLQGLSQEQVNEMLNQVKINGQ